MRTLTESMGQTTEDIEILLIVSSSGTRKGCFQKKKKNETKIFILKFIKMLLFTQKIKKWTFEHDK